MAGTSGENVGGTDIEKNIEREIILQKEVRNQNVHYVWTMW